MQSGNSQGCCRLGSREKSCSVQPTLGFSVALRSKYRKLPISHFSPWRWTSRVKLSRHTIKIMMMMMMMSKYGRTVNPLLYRNRYLHARHEELSMYVCACSCVCARLKLLLNKSLSQLVIMKKFHASSPSEVFFLIGNNQKYKYGIL